jgi:hypothetical protein
MKSILFIFVLLFSQNVLAKKKLSTDYLNTADSVVGDHSTTNMRSNGTFTLEFNEEDRVFNVEAKNFTDGLFSSACEIKLKSSSNIKLKSVKNTDDQKFIRKVEFKFKNKKCRKMMRKRYRKGYSHYLVVGFKYNYTTGKSELEQIYVDHKRKDSSNGIGIGIGVIVPLDK